MATITVSLTDEQLEAIDACLARPLAKDPKAEVPTVEAWVQAQVSALAAACVASCRDEALKASGIASLADLDADEVALLAEAREAKVAAAKAAAAKAKG